MLSYNVHIGIIVSYFTHQHHYINVGAHTYIIIGHVIYLHKRSGSWIPMLSARTDTLLNTAYKHKLY
jgi:hypothetical protein